MAIISIQIALLVSVFLFLLLLYIYKQQKTHGKTKKYHPIGGTVFHLLINFNKVHDYMTNLASKYKTYRSISPLHGEVYTADPVNVEYILKTNFENYGKGAYSRNIIKDLLGDDGILTVDGEEWRKQRKLSSHEFSTRRLRDFSAATFMDNAIKLGKIFLKAENHNQIIDISDLFKKATMDSIIKVGFGVDIDNMSGSSDEGVRFSHAFDDANTLIYHRFVDISWKIKKFLNIGEEVKMKKNIKVIDEYVYKVIQMKAEQMRESKNEFPLNKEDILSRFMQINRDPKYLRDIVLSFMLAGRDPVAVSMCWFIYELCKHPEIQDKVAKDIIEAIDMKEEITNVADFATHLREDALEKMHYLHAALTESIRLHPPLPVDPKICFSDDVLPDGFNVKKGDMVCYMPYAMGRMKFIWGDDALEFKPERWLDENGCFHSESPFKFTAFQGGPRTCLGRDFAYKQMKIFSSVLLGCFVFKLSDENRVPRYKPSINLHIDGPLNVCVFNRIGLHYP